MKNLYQSPQKAYTNQFGHDVADRPAAMYKNIERQIVKIEPVQKRDYEEPIAFREVPLGCTSLTIYMDYAVFVSDNRNAVFEFIRIISWNINFTAIST